MGPVSAFYSLHYSDLKHHKYIRKMIGSHDKFVNCGLEEHVESFKAVASMQILVVGYIRVVDCCASLYMFLFRESWLQF